MSASLGLASGRYESGEGVLRDADLAMYAAKANGKARVELFEHAMRTVAVDRLELVADVQAAVEAGQLRVHLQPVVDLRTLEVEGHEALMRWEHPQRGLLGPIRVHGARRGDRRHRADGVVGARAGVRAGPGLAGRAGRREPRRPAAARSRPPSPPSPAILTRTGIDPRRVVLEITESVFLDTEAIGHRLHQLRALGVLLAIDDFGTGYSSLSYLTRLPVDIVKIDRSFVERLGGPPGDEVLVRAVVQLARSLGLRSVGEGVETPAQLERLQSFGCDAAQGYLFGRPQDGAAASTSAACARCQASGRPPGSLTDGRRASAVQGVEDGAGEVGSADQQVGQPGVGAGCSGAGCRRGGSRAARRPRHRGRRGVVPLVLAAGVGVDVGLAEHHGHGLGAGRAHRHQPPAERLLDQPRLGRADGCGRRGSAARRRRRAAAAAAGRC